MHRGWPPSLPNTRGWEIVALEFISSGIRVRYVLRSRDGEERVRVLVFATIRDAHECGQDMALVSVLLEDRDSNSNAYVLRAAE